jgi:cell division protein FtsN
MARDYKHRTATRARDPRIPGWLWLLAALALGLLVAFVVYLGRLPSPSTAGDKNAAATTATDKPIAEKSTPKTSEIAAEPKAPPNEQFDFFTALPNMRVEVPAEPPKSTPPKPAPTTPAQPKVAPKAGEPPNATPAPPDGETYVLQIGSYRHFKEADAMKAQLALLGVEAKVQRVTIDRSETWFRVRVGPFRSADEADVVRNKLRRHDVRAVVLKLRG